MNLSYNWLKTYLSCDLTPDQVAEAMTSIGIEVDSVHIQEDLAVSVFIFIIRPKIRTGLSGRDFTLCLHIDPAISAFKKLRSGCRLSCKGCHPSEGGQ